MNDDANTGAEHAEETNGAGAALHAVSIPTDDAGAGAGSASEAHVRPRAARRTPPREISVFGAVPVGTTSWGVKRQTRSGGWEPVSFGAGGVELHQFPLSELVDGVILERWGAGTYKVQWWKPGDGGGRKFLGQGPPVTYKDPAAKVEATPVHAPDPIAQHVAFMRMVSTEAEAKIHSTLELARALRGDGQSSASSGISASDLLAIMREERAAAAVALQQATEAQAAATAAQIAALEARLQATIAAQNEEEEGGLAAAAAASLSGKKKAGGFLGFLAAVAEHKDLIKEALPLVVGALTTVNEGLKTTQAAATVAAQQRQQPRPQAQPRGTVVDVELEETELQREQREAYERATAPIPQAPAQQQAPNAPQ